MEIEYAQKGGPKKDPCWIARQDGEETRYKRVVAGIILPNADQLQGGIIILGERYRPAGPADFTAFEAQSGAWRDLQQAIAQFREDFKMRTLVMRPDGQDQKALDNYLRQIRGTATPYMLTTLAPDYALGEIGRQEVDGLIGEGSLHLESVKSVLDPAISHALQCAITWLLQEKSFYQNRPRGPLPRVPWGSL